MPCGSSTVRQPLVDQLPGEVDVGAVSNVTTTCDKPNFEIERMLLQPRQAADRLLDRKRDLPLDFFGAQRRRDRC